MIDMTKCPFCGYDAAVYNTDRRKTHIIRTRKCKAHPLHFYRTVEFPIDDIPNIDKALVELEDKANEPEQLSFL